MFEVDQTYKLIFNINNENKIIIDETLIENLKNENKSSLPKNTNIEEDFSFFYLILDDNIELKLFRYPVECKFIDVDTPIKIFSYEHLKIILERKINKGTYHYPFFYSIHVHKNIYMDINKINDLFIHCYKYIDIKNRDINELKSKTKLIFTELNQLYLINNDKDLSKITYNVISPNFKYYYPKLKIELSDKFIIIPGQPRIEFELKMDDFLKKETNYIYPLCGPYGTGKSITALYFHKLFYVNKIRGLYLNLRYYWQNDKKLENMIDALLNECYFICDNEDELTNLYTKFILKNNFLELMDIISNHINLKNNEKKENKINIYIIIDQYQKK